MLHLLYILAFTVLAFLAVGNLIRNLITLGADARSYGTADRFSPRISRNRSQVAPHPELLDDSGNVVNEPYLVMRSMTVEDAREQLDAIFKASPGSTDTAADDE